MSTTTDIILYRPDYASVRLIECSPPSWMVEMTLREKAPTFAVRELSFAKGEHKTPEMLALNPRGTIPILRHGEVVLSQTLAMLEYIDAACPEPALMGHGTLARGLALERLHESTTIKNRGMDLLAYLMRTPIDQRDSERVRGQLAGVRTELGFWERYYDTCTWAAGESLTLADIALFSYLATFVRLGLALPEGGGLSRMYRRMRERPAVIESWPETWSRGPAAETPLA